MLSYEITLIPEIYKIIKIIPFEFMTIGAIGAYLYTYQRNKILSFSKYKGFYWLVVLLIISFLFIPFFSKYFQSIALSFLFLVLILITINDQNKAVLRNTTISYLGTISYGIYMYHPFIMFLVFPWANSYFKTNMIAYNLFVYLFVFGLTIVLSHLSYKYFELVFIKYKDKKFKSL